MAVTTAGLAWPKLAEPCPPTQSIYSRPSASHSRAPSPRTIAIGRLGYTPLVWAVSAAMIASVDAYGITCFLYFRNSGRCVVLNLPKHSSCWSLTHTLRIAPFGMRNDDRKL